MLFIAISCFPNAQKKVDIVARMVDFDLFDLSDETVRCGKKMAKLISDQDKEIRRKQEEIEILVDEAKKRINGGVRYGLNCK